MTDSILKLFETKKVLSIEEIKEQLEVVDSRDFVELIKNVEKLTRNYILVQLKNEKFLYVADEELFFEGIIRVNNSGFAFVYVDSIESEIYIPKGFSKGAMTGDKVKVRVEDIFVKEKNIEGIVVAILERNTKYTVGTLIKARLFSHVKSDDKNIEKYIKVKNNIKHLVDGSKVIIEITDYAKASFDEHQGIVIKSIGHKDDPGVDILSTAYKHQIPLDFSDDVEKELEKIEDEIHMDPRYKDCTEELVVTIDGDDSKDLDDAISVVKTKKGYRLKVFIADVSRYVKEGSELDKNAIERGCSVYLVDRVIPMLPRKLSNNICSLNPDVLRYTICCDINFEDSGQVIDYDIYPAIIKSKGRLTYKKVNLLFENNEEIVAEYRDYAKMLNYSLELSLKIRKIREQRGAIDFNKAESKVLVDNNGDVVDIVLRERGLAEKLIEDFMLSANEVIAEHFYWLETPFIYRVHEEPKIDKLRQFFELAASFGYRSKGKIEEIEPYVLANMMKTFKNSQVEGMLSTILLRTMNQARYSSINMGHFALSAKYYTHFTSPIRRYPDLLVHRMIRSYLFEGDLSLENKEHFESILPDLAESSSLCEKRAVECEREVDQIKKCEYMLKYQEKTFEGIVSSVTRFGVFVTLPNMIEGLCHIKSMNDDYYTFDEKNIILIGRRTKNIYRIGDSVVVKVANVDIENQEIDFKILKHKGIIDTDNKNKRKLRKKR